MFYLDLAILIHLWVVYGCFCITMAELSSCDKDHKVSRVENTCYLAHYRSLQTPTLEHS